MTMRQTFLQNLAAGLPAEDERLLGNLFTPNDGAPGMHAKAGILPAKAGQVGEVAVLSNTAATVQPFRAVVPGTQGNYQGDYVVASDAAVTVAIGVQAAGVSRYDLLVQRVRDTAYTPNEGADDVPPPAVQAGAPSSGTPVMPTPPPNSAVIGYFTVPASGGTVTFTRTLPFVVPLGGVQPVNQWDTGLGAYVGQMRDHAILGPQRWNGTGWRNVGRAVLTQAQRRALAGADLHAGLEVYETDSFESLLWDPEGLWMPTAVRSHHAPENTANSFANTGWAGTTFAWVPGLGPKVWVPNDAIGRVVELSGKAQILGDGYIRLRRDLDGGGTVYWPNSLGIRSSAAAEDSAVIFGTDYISGAVGATYYLEARSAVAVGASLFVPQLTVTAHQG